MTLAALIETHRQLCERIRICPPKVAFRGAAPYVVGQLLGVEAEIQKMVGARSVFAGDLSCIPGQTTRRCLLASEQEDNDA